MSQRFLFSNGVVYHPPDVPPVSNLLESNPGAYTTTRTHNNGKYLLFWNRHLHRLSNSARILHNSNPHLFFKFRPPTSNFSSPPLWDSVIMALVNDAVGEVLPIAVRERREEGEELAVTALVSGNVGQRNGLDVHVHVGSYVPPVFGGDGARLALVGLARDVAEAKYSDWVRIRKPLENLRLPTVTELLLSNDGDHVLEGCVTNFFVVCRKDNNKLMGRDLDGQENTCTFEVQTAPISDGVLPGIIRQVVFDVCLSKGIPIQEVAPSWSKHECWQEAFITNSLRIVQHVEKIQVPNLWESLQLKTLDEISWEEKQFGDTPGMITAMIQKEIMEKAGLEGALF